GDKDVISQVDRLSSKDTKIARRSVRIAVNASVRSAATCMVVSRVGGLATSLCRARRSLSRRPAHLRRHQYVTCYTEGFSHFVTSMTAPVAFGWSGRRVGLAPTGKRRLLTAHTSRRSLRIAAVDVAAGEAAKPMAELCSDSYTRDQ